MTRHRLAPAIALSALVAAATAAPALAQSAYTGFDRDDRVDGRVMQAAEPATTAPWELLAQNDGAIAARDEMPEAAPVILYRPPARGTPERTTNAAVRGLSEQVALLAPTDHVPLTARAQPTLYWYLGSPARGSLHLVVENLAARQTVADIRWAAPQTAGIRALRLGDLGIRLAPDTNYRWSLTLESTGSPAETHIAMIRRSPAAGAETASAVALADQGYWYDALARLGEGLDTAAANVAPLHAQRAALLQQVGFNAAAAQDRVAVQ